MIGFPHSASASPPCRRGVTLFEITVATALLAVFAGSAAQVMGSLAVGERLAERRALAQRAVDNLLEEVLYDEQRVDAILTMSAEGSPRHLAMEVLPKPVSERLPDAQLEIRATDESGPAGARRIQIRLSWDDPRGQRARPVQLTGWQFPHGDTAP